MLRAKHALRVVLRILITRGFAARVQPAQVGGVVRLIGSVAIATVNSRLTTKLAVPLDSFVHGDVQMSFMGGRRL